MRNCARVAGGRRLAYESWGDPNGSPVFLLHGTPGSRWGPRPRAHELALMGIRLVAYDRPGYGHSDRHVGRRVADAAADVVALADVLGFERFAVVGRSGGGPHALACAALRPDRVLSAAALVSPAPRHADGLDWFAGMGEANTRDYTTAWRASDAPGGPMVLASRLARFTDALTQDFVDSVLGAQVPEADRQILADPGIRGLLLENFRQAAANEHNLGLVRPEPGVQATQAGPGVPVTPGGVGPDAAPDAGAVRVLLGWLDDTLAFSRWWGFRPEDITVPVLLWHGEDDVILPVGHSRWLADRIPGSTLVTEPGAAHFGALVVLPSVLRWLCRFVPPARSDP